MRLTKKERDVIKKQITAFDRAAKVYLFGSRADDGKKGGDIDLLISSEKINDQKLLKIKTELLMALGEQKIDLVLAQNCDPDFLKIIKRGAVLL